MFLVDIILITMPIHYTYTLLYSDEDHWSYEGMEYFGKKLEELKFFSLIK